MTGHSGQIKGFITCRRATDRFDNKDDGVTVIMISHDISAAVQYARHILHLGSRDVFFGSVEEYRESPLGMSFISGAGK